ncbi:hypothetical protein [Leptobacterium sp. I13]
MKKVLLVAFIVFVSSVTFTACTNDQATENNLYEQGTDTVKVRRPGGGD